MQWAKAVDAREEDLCGGSPRVPDVLTERQLGRGGGRVREKEGVRERRVKESRRNG